MLMEQINLVDKKKVIVNFIQTDPHFNFVLGSFTKDYRFTIETTNKKNVFICIINIQTLLKFVAQKNRLRFLNKTKQQNEFQLPSQLVLNDFLINKKPQYVKIGKAFDNKQLIGFSDFRKIQIIQLQIINRQYKARTILGKIKFQYDIIFFTFHYQYLNLSFYNGEMKFINCYQKQKTNSFFQQNYENLTSDYTPNLDQYMRIIYSKQKIKVSGKQRLGINHVYQAFDGQLLHNGDIVSRQFAVPFFQDPLQQIKFVTQLGGQSSPIKYRASPCQNYLIGKTGKYGKWLIRNRINNWQFLFQWDEKPFIYPFMSNLHKIIQACIFKNESQNYKIRRISDKIQYVIIAYLVNKALKITILKVDKAYRKKKVQRINFDNDEQIYNLYNLEQRQILSLQIDEQITKVRWVGPESLMLIKISGELLYLQKINDRIAEAYYHFLGQEMILESNK